MTLIADIDGHDLLGVTEMDAVHREFAALVNNLEAADAPAFAAGFAHLLAHTAKHFANEEALMQDSRFPARAEHLRVLGDLHHFARQVERGRTTLARAYLCEQIPAWFALHAVTMDSALAAHLKAVQKTGAEA